MNWRVLEEPGRFYGLGKQDGDNLQVKAGIYAILFNDLTEEYILKKKANTST